MRKRGSSSLPARSEAEALAALRALADRNRVVPSLIGMGYHDTITPPVIRRNILENPAWYTAYTPYQPEISQGRLEALLNFQTMVCDLTGLQVANASLLDEATAAAEAMTLARRASKAPEDAVFVVDVDCHPQTIAVVRTRAEPLGLRVVAADLRAGARRPRALRAPGLPTGVQRRLLEVGALRALADAVHERGGLVVARPTCSPSPCWCRPASGAPTWSWARRSASACPWASVVPTPASWRCATGLERSLPGRLVGVSVDADGSPALRLALQTREQHIRREKATSNICTAQVLLAVIAGMYAVYHGPEGLTAIAGTRPPPARASWPAAARTPGSS